MPQGLPAAVAAVLIALAGGSTAFAAELPPGNLTANPSFETSVDGWHGGHAQVRRVAVAGAPHGSFAAQVVRRQLERYVLTDLPDTVASTTAGSEYEASAWVRAASPGAVGKRLVLRVRERAADGSIVTRATTRVTLANGFQQVSASITAAGAGNALDVRLIRPDSTAGEAFQADAISLVQTATPPPGACPDGEFQAKYFPNQLLEGPPTATRCVDAVDEDWGSGGPAGLGGDNWGASYEGRISFDEADYELLAGADDGVRVYVDGELVIDDWVDHAFRTQLLRRAMTGGLHTVKVEFHENGGDARVLLRLTSLDPGDPALFPVDGGLDYYSRFSNALPSDPSFFPLAVWLPCVDSQEKVGMDKDVGLNVYVGLCQEGPESMRLARDNGMRVIPQQNEWAGNPAVGSESAGWLVWDEADMQMDPQDGFRFLDGILASLPQDGRLRYANYGKGVAYWLNDVDAARYLNDFQDVVSTDIYWFADNQTCGDNERSKPGVIASNGCHVGANYGWVVNRERNLISPARSKPVWAFVEVGHPAREDDWPTITPPQIRSATWHSLIAGARGVVYFNHSFGGDCQTPNVLREPCAAETRAAVRLLNGQITSLAPVLNAPTVQGGWVQGDNTRTMVKWHDGHFYVFMGAVSTGGTGTFTLDCIGDATATVIDEDRTVPVEGGVLSDSFADANAVHIYRIDGGGGCGLS